MTQPSLPTACNERKTSPSAGQIFFCLMSTFCFCLILRNSDVAIEYIGRGLKLCTQTVIPSLFPFMVISELLVESGAGEALGKFFSRLMRWLFGLSGAGGSAVFLGSLCGFPIGAKTAVSLYDRNMISKTELEHLLTFSNNPSSAFLINAVGISLFANRRIGLILYVIVLVSSFVVGFFMRFFLRGPHAPKVHKHYPTGLHPGGVQMFTDSVTHAANGMILICAYVIFFSALTGALSCMINNWGGIPSLLHTLLFGFLELSGGVSEASSLPDLPMALVVTAAVAGWSGLSVHCQIMTLCSGRGISFKPYVLAKIAQGLLCALLMGLVLHTAPPSFLNPDSDTLLETAYFAWDDMKEITLPDILTNGVFICGWIGGLFDTWSRKNPPASHRVGRGYRIRPHSPSHKK